MSLLAAVIEDLHDWHPEDSAWSASRVGPSGMDLRAVWTANIDAITNMITASAFSLFCVSWFLSISLASVRGATRPTELFPALACTAHSSISFERSWRAVQSVEVAGAGAGECSKGVSPTSMLEGGGAQLEEFRKRPLAQNQSSGVHRNPRQQTDSSATATVACCVASGARRVRGLASGITGRLAYARRDEDVPLASPLPAQAPPAHGHVNWLELFEDSSYRL